MGEGAGSKAGNTHTASEIKKHRRERARQLLVEVHGLASDPNLSKDGTGKYVCLLCKTKHLSELSYAKHRDGRKHKAKSAKKEGAMQPATPSYRIRRLASRGRTGYAITISYELGEEMPCHRFVRSLEQSVEEYDEKVGYVVVICRPYENIGFKFASREIDKASVYEDMEEESGTYTLHFYFAEGGDGPAEQGTR